MLEREHSLLLSCKHGVTARKCTELQRRIAVHAQIWASGTMQSTAQPPAQPHVGYRAVCSHKEGAALVAAPEGHCIVGSSYEEQRSWT